MTEALQMWMVKTPSKSFLQSTIRPVFIQAVRAFLNGRPDGRHLPFDEWDNRFAPMGYTCVPVSVTEKEKTKP